MSSSVNAETMFRENNLNDLALEESKHQMISRAQNALRARNAFNRSEKTGLGLEKFE
jgi:hypothetical protein